MYSVEKIKIVLTVTMAMFFASISSSITKYIIVDIYIYELLFFRFLLGSLILLSLIKFAEVANEMKRPAIHLVRAIILVSMTFFFFSAISRIGLSRSVSVLYLYPAITLFLSYLVFKFETSPLAVAGVIGSFVAVYLIIQPDPQSLNLGLAFALLSALLISARNIFDKIIMTNCSPITLNFIGFAIATALLAPFCYDSEIWFDPKSLLTIFALALFASLSQLLVTMAIRSGRWDIIGISSYWEVVITTILGVTIFSETIGAYAVVGIVLMIVSSIPIFLNMDRQRSGASPK